MSRLCMCQRDVSSTWLQRAYAFSYLGVHRFARTTASLTCTSPPGPPEPHLPDAISWRRWAILCGILEVLLTSATIMLSCYVHSDLSHLGGLLHTKLVLDQSSMTQATTAWPFISAQLADDTWSIW